MAISENQEKALPTRREVSDEYLKELLTLVASGDRTAFKSLYQITSGSCYSIVLRMLNNPEDAQDVLQKAYVSIWKNAVKYNANKGKAFTWIVTVMKNRAIDTLRSRARAPQTELIEDQHIDPSQTASTRAESFLIAKLLEKGFSKLPKHVATAVRMNVVEGYSSSEIGLQMNVSRHTVKTWIRRGLANLRRDLPLKSFDGAI